MKNNGFDSVDQIGLPVLRTGNSLRVPHNILTIRFFPAESTERRHGCTEGEKRKKERKKEEKKKIEKKKEKNEKEEDK